MLTSSSILSVFGESTEEFNETITKFDQDFDYIQEHVNFTITTREYYKVYGLANGNPEEAIKIFNNPHYHKNVFGSSYEQISIGIEPENILCRDGLELHFKIDNTPICIKESTFEKLKEHGCSVS